MVSDSVHAAEEDDDRRGAREHGVPSGRKELTFGGSSASLVPLQHL